MKDYIYIALRGMAMGIAEVIPGVSGGTIAFITGIYEKLINTIKAFGPQAIQAWREGGAKQVWQTINGNFLLALGAGMLVGIVIGVLEITYLLDNYPIMLWAFFFGLIIASALYVGRQVKDWHIGSFVALFVGAAVAYGITAAVPAEGNTALWFVFLSGTIAISALLLPGVSGSFVLLLLGMYTFIIPNIENALKTFDSESLTILAVFGAGCIVGLATFSRILSWTFQHYENTTLALLTGFMIGSLNKIWPWRVPEQWLVKNKAGIYEVPTGTFDYESYQTTLAEGSEIKLIAEENISPFQFELLTSEPKYLTGALICMAVGFSIVFLAERLTK
jgi:putative membrane protein